MCKVKHAHRLVSTQALSPTWMLKLMTASLLYQQCSRSWCWCLRTVNLIWTPNNSVLQEHAASIQSIAFVCWVTQCSYKTNAVEEVSVALGLPLPFGRPLAFWYLPFGWSSCSDIIAHFPPHCHLEEMVDPVGLQTGPCGFEHVGLRAVCADGTLPGNIGSN